MSSFGVGLTRLRVLSRAIGRGHPLAQQPRTSDCFDARVVSLLIDDPDALTWAQAESQVEELQHGMLALVVAP